MIHELLRNEPSIRPDFSVEGLTILAYAGDEEMHTLVYIRSQDPS